MLQRSNLMSYLGTEQKLLTQNFDFRKCYRSFFRGVNEGRRGLGNIYVWASGDGGEDDDCNCDG